MDQSKDLLKKISECGIRPSHQRLAVYANLCGRTDHPTAETIYGDLKAKLPTLSLTTIYNTLHLFCRHGIALQVASAKDNEMRFDGNVKFHYHFKCDGCGEVFDIHPTSEDIFHPIIPKGFRLRCATVSFSGLCPSCATSIGG